MQAAIALQYIGKGRCAERDVLDAARSFLRQFSAFSDEHGAEIDTYEFDNPRSHSQDGRLWTVDLHVDAIDRLPTPPQGQSREAVAHSDDRFRYRFVDLDVDTPTFADFRDSMKEAQGLRLVADITFQTADIPTDDFWWTDSELFESVCDLIRSRLIDQNVAAVTWRSSQHVGVPMTTSEAECRFEVYGDVTAINRALNEQQLRGQQSSTDRFFVEECNVSARVRFE